MSNARQVDLLLSGIFGLDGAPLSGGKVYCYNAGSSTLKNVYNDVGLTVASENPVILDENGKAIKYALGSYKFVVKDANDSTLYTYDNLTYGFNPESVTADYSGSIYLASMGGDSSAMQGSTTLTTPINSLAEGMRFVFQSPFDCADDATIAIDEADAADLYIADGSTPVTAGYIEEGQFYEIIYDGSVFRVLSTTGAIGTDKIGTGVIAGSNLQNGAIDTAQLKDGAVTTDKLADSSVTTGKLNDGSVTTAKLANKAVTTAKLDDGAITEDKIGTGAITTTKVADYAITGDKIADVTIASNKLQTDSVTTTKIKDAAVSSRKLNDYASLNNLKQDEGTEGTYSLTEGKIFFNSSASGSKTITLNVYDAKCYPAVPLFFNKQNGSSTLIVNIIDMNNNITATYTVSLFLVLLKKAYNSWTILHNS